MRILSASNSYIEALSATYPYDGAVKFLGDVDYCTDGYVLKSCELFANPNDVNKTDLTSVFLTQPKSLSALVTLVEPTQIDTFFTFLQSPRSGRYLSISPAGTVAYTAGAITEASTFEIVFVNELQLQIITTNGLTQNYLTVVPATSTLTFSTSGADSSLQQFYYFFNKDQTQLSLFTILSGHTMYVEDNLLGGLALANDNQMFINNTFNTRAYYPDYKYAALLNPWLSYSTGSESNTVTINDSKSNLDVENNYTAFGNHWNIINGELMISIVPMKNQLTPEGDLSRGNIYNGEDETTQRLYYALHLDGNTITSSYWSGVNRLILPKNTLTYFRFPYVSTPYVRLNIKDSSLIKAGAIGGDVPINADKVFKQRASDFNDFAILDEQSGTWLCAWLSAGPNGSQWVDRYYNPNYVNFVTALSASAYTDEFTTTTQNNNKTSTLIFDLPSKLVFEPHALYAYHHIGNADMQKLIDTRGYGLQTSGINVFRTFNGALVIPGQDTTGTTIYNFTGREQGLIFANTITGSFTVSFFLHVNDYSDKFTTNIISSSGTNLFSITNPTSGVLTATLSSLSANYAFNFGLSAFSFGWHHFAFVNNTEQGQLQLWVDGQLQSSAVFDAGAYSFTPFINGTVTVGTSANSKFAVKDVRIYDIPLSQFDIRNHAYVFSTIRDIKWAMPAGQRSFLDTIERFFRYAIPGRVTGMFNVTIQNSNILDPAVQAALETNIVNVISQTSPVYTKLNQIIWRDNV